MGGTTSRERGTLQSHLKKMVRSIMSDGFRTSGLAKVKLCQTMKSHKTKLTKQLFQSNYCNICQAAGCRHRHNFWHPFNTLWKLLIAELILQAEAVYTLFCLLWTSSVQKCTLQNVSRIQLSLFNAKVFSSLFDATHYCNYWGGSAFLPYLQSNDHICFISNFDRVNLTLQPAHHINTLIGPCVQAKEANGCAATIMYAMYPHTTHSLYIISLAITVCEQIQVKSQTFPLSQPSNHVQNARDPVASQDEDK